MPIAVGNVLFNHDVATWVAIAMKYCPRDHALNPICIS